MTFCLFIRTDPENKDVYKDGGNPADAGSDGLTHSMNPYKHANFPGGDLLNLGGTPIRKCKFTQSEVRF